MRTVPAWLRDFFDPDDYFTGPPLTAATIRATEKQLGYKLPALYRQLLLVKNGGSPRRQCFPTQARTSWESDHIRVNGICGIGGRFGIETSPRRSREWGYPEPGLVIGIPPSSGHTAVLLDYRECGPKGEPRVIWVEAAEAVEDQAWVLVLAPTFEAFARGLVDCDQFE
jgi:hypothetical protein